MEIVNKKTGDTKFHQIVGCGYEQTRNFCECKDFDVRLLEVSNDLKQRPIHIAVASKCPKLVSYLLKKDVPMQHDPPSESADEAFSAPQDAAPTVDDIDTDDESIIDQSSSSSASSMSSEEDEEEDEVFVSSKLDDLVFLAGPSAQVDSFKKADWTSLMVACALSGTQAAPIVRILLDSGANAELRNKDGWTVMHIASKAGNLDTIRLLVTHRPALVTAPSRNGRLPIHMAALNCHEEAVQFLLDAGGTVTCSHPDACGSTAALDASSSGNVPILRLLSKATDLKTHRDARGLSCLHKAASAGHVEAVRFLLGEEAFDVDQETDDGFTALMLAVMESQVPVAQLLARTGARTQTTKRKVYNLSRGLPKADIEDLFCYEVNKNDNS